MLNLGPRALVTNVNQDPQMWYPLRVSTSPSDSTGKTADENTMETRLVMVQKLKTAEVV